MNDLSFEEENKGFIQETNLSEINITHTENKVVADDIILINQNINENDKKNLLSNYNLRQDSNTNNYSSNISV